MKNLKELLKRQQKLSSNEFKRRAKRFIKKGIIETRESSST
ncbi:MAG: hypothetical protein ACTHKC_02550 [Candidatus Nitrosocosmicus sp.]